MQKRRYPKSFISKLSDGDGENAETQARLQFVFTCQYVDKATPTRLYKLSLEVGKLLRDMRSSTLKNME